MATHSVWLCNHYAAPPALTTLIRPYLFGKILRERGYDVTVFAASKIHNMDKNLIADRRSFLRREEEGVPFVYLRTCDYTRNDAHRMVNMLQYAWRLWRVGKKLPPPDLLVATSAHPLTCVAALKLAKRFGVPCVVEIGDLWPESIVAYGMMGRHNPAVRALYHLEKWMYRKADAVVFTMQGGADYIRDQVWDRVIDMRKIHHINNGVDLAAFDANALALRWQDDVLDDPGVFKAVYVGSIREVNDVGKLVDVAKVLADRGRSDIRLVIYGDGTQRADIERRAQEMGLTNIVFRGFVAKKYIPNILKRGDLNIIQVKQTDIMRYGSSMNKLFDYFASAKPVLSTLRVSYDLIAQHDCGVTTQTQDENEIADEICRFADMPKEEYDACCARAREAAQAFDYPRLVDQLEDIMNGLWSAEDKESNS
ncbi:MAG: glycosyltransferase family 4 protein [Eubacteriales bacterium]|nr:glycosyltransferase family 4 protein [Eubacteriales bacterium]